ncbi:16S rRNA (guanine(966)-N(2))-methyltransferase RsmD [Robbsia sp. Bb-Pol-6]|uniref:16S rRNA (Guanine(966)-N(2))-methyltransferase RsmD n=1 Tax=Robbsia betulipollinis TaxID=2981849 RepID=A0ABT3ZMK0_9BURK|nr:16S rRNA (guanine(966)-N(2))-methyltransferase RsmD [Robbsia betulipollinis]MCY0387170.1 16S rRNA (guanine(966)-N(2))-methyltransferase RsmD [Robbsia betulipollinis]
MNRPSSSHRARSGAPASSAPTDRKAAARAVRHAPQQVRIIGGDWKRTPLQVVDAQGLRPTPDRVRETLFNWLGQELAGAVCLDLFAGTGALGFEAASRGARRVLLVERQAKAAAQLRAVKARLGAGAVEVAEADALRLAAGLAPQSFDVIFIDPPFDGALLAKALPVAARLASAAGDIYVESPVPLDPEAARALPPEMADPALAAAFAQLHAVGWRIARYGKAGAVHYHLLRQQADEAADETADETAGDNG